MKDWQKCQVFLAVLLVFGGLLIETCEFAEATCCNRTTSLLHLCVLYCELFIQNHRDEEPAADEKIE